MHFKVCVQWQKKKNHNLSFYQSYQSLLEQETLLCWQCPGCSQGTAQLIESCGYVSNSPKKNLKVKKTVKNIPLVKKKCNLKNHYAPVSTYQVKKNYNSSNFQKTMKITNLNFTRKYASLSKHTLVLTSTFVFVVEITRLS